MVTLRFNYLNEIYGEFNLSTKFTFIQGHSGTGKTTIIEKLKDPDTKVEISDNYDYVYLSGALKMEEDGLLGLLDYLSKGKPTVFYMDEDDIGGYPFKFQKIFAESKYLFLIVYRAVWDEVAYGVESFKQLCYKKLGKHKHFYYLKNLYAQFKEIPQSISKVVTEDSKSGLEFLNWLLEKKIVKPSRLTAMESLMGKQVEKEMFHMLSRILKTSTL